MRGPERSDIPDIRRLFGKLGLPVAEVDRDLRYVWFDNSHAGLTTETVAGKRADEFLSDIPAKELMALKRDVFNRKTATSKILSFNAPEGWHHYSVFVYPIRSSNDAVDSLLVFAFETFGSTNDIP